MKGTALSSRAQDDDRRKKKPKRRYQSAPSDESSYCYLSVETVKPNRLPTISNNSFIWQLDGVASFLLCNIHITHSCKHNNCIVKPNEKNGQRSTFIPEYNDHSMAWTWHDYGYMSMTLTFIYSLFIDSIFYRTTTIQTRTHHSPPPVKWNKNYPLVSLSRGSVYRVRT